ncbi:glycosyl transferase [Caldicellulosiruptor changbaiensis]|uniref:Glycosyl transferase n=1 Tax=Caldicellulosiruptor changbaiensis TaxID=1222016 RepID=A0A3T0D2Q1_9FIRM|nr:nucleotide disphospho-sugar-binding domain-containing protein [Caldicellulosiruptor changbaiensis]AZT89561.1 glycosyl transferase [Caldicellulosiruptor changbaiensis]
MKKVFLQFGSGLGPMSRSLPIAEGLQREGYIVKYFGFENAKPYMNKMGIEELSENFNIKDIKKGVQTPNWYCAEQFWEIIGYGNIEWVEKKVEELIEYLRDFSPDFIISDLGILSCIAARIMDIPLIAITQSCYHPNIAFGRIRWWEEEQNLKFTLTEKLNNYFKKKGVSQLNSFEEIFTGSLTIIPSFPEFDPINDPSEFNTHYVGPILWDPLDMAKEEYIKLFNRDKNKPTIFCYTARFYDNVGESGIIIFKTLLSALKEFDANIIFSTGSDSDRKIAKEISNSYGIDEEKFSIIDWVPMGIAYGNSDVVIHHGGHGSCLGQFLYEVPSLIIPTHTEREYNARICTKMGVSKFIKREDIGKANILAEIAEILSNSSFKERLHFWHAKLNEYNFTGVNKVLELIQKL